jgi:Uma2 family endonuclease
MTAVLSPPPTAETRVVLHNISWKTYERLLEDLADCSAPRLTYDRGELEIMSPTAKHEDVNETVKLLVNGVAEEIGLVLRGLGSTTFAREDIERGFEPDSCFYIQHESLIRGKARIDLAADPPPDLVFEVDITSSSIDKQSIFAQVGVPEVWRYDGEKMDILILRGKAYQKSEASTVIPLISAEVLTAFVSESLTLNRLEWMKRARDWARAQKEAR